MLILDHEQIRHTIRRLAIEIVENNYKEKKIILAGINNNGLKLSELIKNELMNITEMEVVLTNISVDAAAPTSKEIVLDLPLVECKRAVVFVVDDVANTGRTLFYAMKPLMDVLCKKVEAIVMVDRSHKSFPVRVDYVGMTLATTLKEHILVSLDKEDAYAVTLD